MSLRRHYFDLLAGRGRGPAAAITRGLLTGAEWIYRGYIRCRNEGFDAGWLRAIRVWLPVVSVGNLTVGGTGKTPLVLWLAQWFLDRGVPVSLLSRGYGTGGREQNDEARELAQRLTGVPHFQNPDRVAAARRAAAENPRQVLILDDAFQHRRLARDLDIVLLDAMEPFGYGRLLPRGLLREPPESLARAHIVGLSRADAVSEHFRRQLRSQVQTLAPEAAWMELVHRPWRLLNHAGQSQPLSALAGKKVLAFCGIGNPAGFAHTLGSAGMEVIERRDYPDHHRYDQRDLTELERWPARHGQATAVVCTHKDLVKLSRERLGGLPLWALTIELEIIAGADSLTERLDKLAQQCRVGVSDRCPKPH
jgi:tetraacyldisaccharide 4'-kinase